MIPMAGGSGMAPPAASGLRRATSVEYGLIGLLVAIGMLAGLTALGADKAAAGQHQQQDHQCYAGPRALALLHRWANPALYGAKRLGKPYRRRSRPQRLLLAFMRCPAR